MEQEVKDFGRFFALLRKMPYKIDDDERHSFVLMATGGRTNSLREMTRSEYDDMCNQLDGLQTIKNAGLRHRRSCVLRQMQKLGVDTTDWVRIDALCMDARIAGKKFSSLSIAELRQLETKLRAIGLHGGLGNTKSEQTVSKCKIVPLNINNI